MTAREYVETNATSDVLATISWLDGRGWKVAREDPEPGQHMGNVYLTFMKARQITIASDRSQWIIGLALAPGEREFWLDVLDAARLGRVWEPGPVRALGDPLATQLPEGVSWREVLPEVLTWLDTDGAEEKAREATRLADKAMKRRWKQP